MGGGVQKYNIGPVAIRDVWRGTADSEENGREEQQPGNNIGGTTVCFASRNSRFLEASFFFWKHERKKRGSEGLTRQKEGNNKKKNQFRGTPSMFTGWRLLPDQRGMGYSRRSFNHKGHGYSRSWWQIGRPAGHLIRI